MTISATTIAFAAAALALQICVRRRVLLTGGAALLAVASALPMRAPCMLAAATIVVFEGLPVPAAVTLLASAVVGLGVISFANVIPVLSVVLAGGLVVKAVVIARRRAPRGSLLAEEGVMVALAAAVSASVMETIAPHRLSGLIEPSALAVAATFAIVAVAAREHEAHALTRRRLAGAQTRSRARLTLSAAAPPLPEGPRGSHELLTQALRQIVHELRQPIGAASNALATAKLDSTDKDTAHALEELAASELHHALESLEAIARYARMSAGYPVLIPSDDAVEVALGAHIGSVDFARGASNSVAVDPAQLGHALDALVRNARDAQPEGLIRVETAVDPDTGSLIVRIIDAGDAPLGDNLQHAPIPFYTSRAGRLGLGASVAARFANAVGGSLRIERHAALTIAELTLPASKAR